MKAVMIRGVAQDEGIYHTTSESEHESLSFLVQPSPPPIPHDKAPAAFTKYKNGWIGYFGSGNSDEEEQQAVKLICDFAHSQYNREVSALEGGRKREADENRSNKRKKTKSDDRDHSQKKKFLFPCRFFKEGTCKKGAECTFRHD